MSTEHLHHEPEGNGPMDLDLISLEVQAMIRAGIPQELLPPSDFGWSEGHPIPGGGSAA